MYFDCALRVHTKASYYKLSRDAMCVCAFEHNHTIML